MELEQMKMVNGGRSSIEFIIMCGILSTAMGMVTFGLGLLGGLACAIFQA